MFDYEHLAIRTIQQSNLEPSNKYIHVYTQSSKSIGASYQVRTRILLEVRFSLPRNSNRFWTDRDLRLVRTISSSYIVCFPWLGFDT